MLSSQSSDSRQIDMNAIAATTSAQFAKHNLRWVDVSWDDNTRSANSCLGPKISDWTLQLPNKTRLKFLRRPNFTDETLSIHAKDLSVTVETSEGYLKAITYDKYLKYFGKYTPGVPDHLDMSDMSPGENEVVTVRFVGIPVPVDHTGTQEVVPTAYSYQTLSKSNPSSIIGASFHLGTGAALDGPGTEKVWLVKSTPNDDGAGAGAGEEAHVDSDDWPTSLSPHIKEACIKWDPDSKCFTDFLKLVHMLASSQDFSDFGESSGYGIESVTDRDVVDLAKVLYNLPESDKWLDEEGKFSSAYTKWESGLDGTDIKYDSSTKRDSTYEDTWFRITDSEHETEEQKKAVGSVLGTRSTGKGRNRVMCFQIPRKQPVEKMSNMRSFSQDRGADECCMRSMGAGNVSFGTSVGKHTFDPEISLVRDTDHPITVTFGIWRTVKDTTMSPADVDAFASEINQCYRDTKALWVGSLVTGEKNTSVKSSSTEAPIVFPKASMADVEAYNAKVTMFPKCESDVSDFPT
jgi:hypothetical protein